MHQGTDRYYTIYLFLFRQLLKACNIIEMKTNQSNESFIRYQLWGEVGNNRSEMQKAFVLIVVNSGKL